PRQGAPHGTGTTAAAAVHPGPAHRGRRRGPGTRPRLAGRPGPDPGRGRPAQRHRRRPGTECGGVRARFRAKGRPVGMRTPEGPSFVDYLARERPDLLPAREPTPAPEGVRHATTIAALAYDGGVVMAGDRRATIGNVIASRHMEKVFSADRYSVVGIAGSAGIGLDLVRLFQVELEHYEKIEGELLSLDGKANRLAAMIRANLGRAMQGMSVVPLFAGYDPRQRTGRIFS